MTYKILRITNYYPQYLKSFYSKNAAIAKRSYTEQYAAIIDDSSEIAGAYSKNLNNIKGVEAIDIISNAEPLQNAWRTENNLAEDISTQQLILHQIIAYKPTVLWLDDFSFFDNSFKELLVKEVPTLKLITGHICAPYNSELLEKLKLLDVVFTCIPCFKNDLNNAGIKTHLLYHGFESTILNRITDTNFPQTSVLFSGSLYIGGGFHNVRLQLIEKLLKAGIQLDLYCNLESAKKIMFKKLFYYIINFIKTIKLNFLINKIAVLKRYESYADAPIKNYSQQLLESAKPPVFGLDMYKLLSKADITLNTHGEIANKCAGNIRLFEATGVGTCLVTDWKDNINELFEPGKEIVTYTDFDDCVNKINWLIQHPDERKKIAAAGQAKTLKYHTVENRANALHEILINELAGK